jgi:hypothetical protein
MQAFVRCASRRWSVFLVAVLPLLSAVTASPLRSQGPPREGQSATPEKNVGSPADTVPRIAALTVEGGGWIPRSTRQNAVLLSAHPSPGSPATVSVSPTRCSREISGTRLRLR